MQTDSLLKYQEQEYRVVKIGEQWWIAQNLNSLPDEVSPADSSYWCYNNLQENCRKYGKLYNFESAQTACPCDWKLPSKTDFDDLLEFIENRAENIFGGTALKSEKEWESINSDLYGFSALPSGFRDKNGNFATLGTQAFFWTSTESENQVYHRALRNDQNLYSGLSDKELGYSIRCVK
ncbi:hypothetical protein AGMMS49938_03520 [Fibrobacterales bacterium]|nr:hypothetical protein AGMMS49938_03520 [Fibrobacterales bacterium]